ncbi:IclR family transcriptional regulator [Marinomonas posidonica]|uniref:Transcriptional regulator, IclR family n=1 Tax=Marinomonas posidonica (strain CECT 7376 / NCIMB 14433 / IVIA-Po-181) TaxID=491952 RepID=F6CWX9_MARPP|nr:IclR family transcriptional regulator [Marinomonas posidonica]AEF55541.1 transcriptional regulator, IclR family [Marinomonas posidonica IVIA-Po-181]
MTKTTEYQVPALSRGLQIIEMFDSQKRVLNTQDFADNLGVSASSTYRIVQTLLDMGYLKKVTRNAYELGPQVVSRGFAFLAGKDLVDIAAPYLNDLRDRTSISCHLGIRDGLETVYIYRSQASQRLSVNIPLGSRLPCHTNAMGRVLLQQLSDIELNAMYQTQQLDSYPGPYPQSFPELKALLKKEWEQGYSSNRSDNATAIAVPITNYLGKTIAAINISGADQVMNHQAQFEAAKEELLNTASAISQLVP